MEMANRLLESLIHSKPDRNQSKLTVCTSADFYIPRQIIISYFQIPTKTYTKKRKNVMMLVKLFTYATVVVPNEKIHGVCNSI